MTQWVPHVFPWLHTVDPSCTWGDGKHWIDRKAGSSLRPSSQYPARAIYSIRRRFESDLNTSQAATIACRYQQGSSDQIEHRCSSLRHESLLFAVCEIESLRLDLRCYYVCAQYTSDRNEQHGDDPHPVTTEFLSESRLRSNDTIY